MIVLERLQSHAKSHLLGATRVIAQKAFERGYQLDDDASFPDEELKHLHNSGLLAAPLRHRWGGVGLGIETEQAKLTVDVLSTIGWGNLPLGRIFEGHVNALRLIQDHGREDQIEQLIDDVRNGRVFGVWNTEGVTPVELIASQSGFCLSGSKVFASGAGHIERPLITATKPNGEMVMVVPREITSGRADTSTWRAHGMRASASGVFDFTGIKVCEDEIMGAAGAYSLQPAFSAGAWRFCAVQLGGILRLLDEVRTHLVQCGRASDPHQQARVGTAAVAAQGARHWVESAALRVDACHDQDPRELVAFVNLARVAVERAGLDVIELAQRSVGLAGFQRTHPMERVMRDLAVYLRQPAPDKALTEAADFVLTRDMSALDLWRSHEG